MRFRITAMLTACLVAIGFGSFLTAAPSFAQAGGDQFCFSTSYCINAWNGGPYIDVYGPNVANNVFSLVQNGNYWDLQFTNTASGSYGECIGDYGNSSTNARAALDSDDCAAGQIAWGANFTTPTAGCPPGEFALRNVHWGGYLGPSTSGLGNGDAFYLNNADEFCYNETFF
jgi:hypothetical protein